MAVLYREQMDVMANNGCQTPGCHHEHDGVVFLHSRCHVGGNCDAGFIKVKGEPWLEISCGDCGTYICSLVVEKTLPLRRCHIDASLEICYKAGGFLEIACNECKAVLAEARVPCE